MEGSKWAEQYVGDDWYAPPSPRQEPGSSAPEPSTTNTAIPEPALSAPSRQSPMEQLRQGLAGFAMAAPSSPAPPNPNAGIANPAAPAAVSTAAPATIVPHHPNTSTANPATTTTTPTAPPMQAPPPAPLTGHVLVHPIPKFRASNSLPTAENPSDRAVLVDLTGLSPSDGKLFQAFWDRARAALPALGHGAYLRLVVPGAGLRVDVNGGNVGGALGVCREMVGAGAYLEYVFEDRVGLGRRG
ncbi:MAG: hypothetical protein M1831_007417 [Alyxoria varia]|nr:MAG: hypothetical protein M1831_007417 [Alyxoria varia]